MGVILAGVQVRFEDGKLGQLETDSSLDGGYGPGIGSVFRKRMQFIRAAKDERDFYAMKSLHFEKLEGNLAGKHSMRLNKQWRLILGFEGKAPDKVVVIFAIADYH